MKTVKVKMRTATPMVMGGADNTSVKSSGLRAASIKGALRFWYRAMNIGDIDGETRIFGGQRNQGNQSSFILQVTRNPAVNEIPGTDWRYGSGYLAGPGLYRPGRRPDRGFKFPYIDIDKDIELTMHFKPNTATDDIEAVLRSLWVLCYLGGLGSRSRRAFGSVQLLEIEGQEYEYPIPNNRVELIQVLRQFMQSFSNLPDDSKYTAFTTGTRIVVSKEYDDSIKAMQAADRKLSDYRSFISEKKAVHYDSKDHDHDLVLNFLKGKDISTHPKRVVFGLPHNYFYSSTRMSASVTAQGTDIGDRRGSPLFIHVQKLSEASSVVVYTLFPTEFLPVGAKIKISSNANLHKAEPDVDYNIIHRYLDAIRGDGGLEVKFDG